MNKFEDLQTRKDVCKLASSSYQQQRLQIFNYKFEFSRKFPANRIFVLELIEQFQPHSYYDFSPRLECGEISHSSR